MLKRSMALEKREASCTSAAVSGFRFKTTVCENVVSDVLTASTGVVDATSAPASFSSSCTVRENRGTHAGGQFRNKGDFDFLALNSVFHSHCDAVISWSELNSRARSNLSKLTIPSGIRVKHGFQVHLQRGVSVAPRDVQRKS